MLYVVCNDVTSHTSLITLRYTTVADYYFARRHIVVHFSAVDPLPIKKKIQHVVQHL
jgi:hypothetical protein